MSDTEEVYPEPEESMVEPYSNSSPEEPGHCEENDDDDETLSFCDLPIHSSSSSSSNNSSSEDSRSSFGRYQQEDEEDGFFEFSSDDFTATAYPAKNIIFCGKIIPHKYPSQPDLFPSSAAAEATRSPMPLEPEKCKGLPTPNNNNKVSVLTAYPSRSKWMLFMLGFANLPYSQMELNGVKSSRPRPRTSRSVSSSSLKEVGKSSSSRSRKGKGCWETIKAGIGCSSIHADEVVDACFARR